MNNIPITFEWEGKTYAGYFRKVSGAAGTGSWHLMSNDNFYLGQLINTDFGWQFHNNKDQFKGMAEYFGSYITSGSDGEEK